MLLKKYIKYLSESHGVSGFEFGPAEYLKNILKEKFGIAHIDNMGNVIACKKSTSSRGKIMLEAHMDEIGFIVKNIDDNGFLGIVPLGGIDPRILPGNVVDIHSDNKIYKAVVGAKPPHVMTADEYDKLIEFDELYLDAGMTKEEASALINIGSTVTFAPEFYELFNDNITSKCMDDRASVAVLLDIADTLSDKELPFDLYITICVQEEVGLRGSVTAAYSVNPDFAIAIDVTHAKTPDESKLDISLGSGIVVCKGPNIHPRLVSSFISYLDKSDISYEIEIEGGNTGTDAWAIQTAREGIPVMLLSLPLKYMHTPVETICLSDCQLLSDALSAYLLSVKEMEDLLC